MHRDVGRASNPLREFQIIVEGFHFLGDLNCTSERRKSVEFPPHIIGPRPENREVFEVRDEGQVFITHNYQVPVLVGANPTIKALVSVGNAFVPCAVITVGAMCISNTGRRNFLHTPHTPGGVGEVNLVVTTWAHLPSVIPASTFITPASIGILMLGSR